MTLEASSEPSPSDNVSVGIEPQSGTPVRIQELRLGHRPLSLELVMAELLKSGLVDHESAERIVQQATGVKEHPLVVVERCGAKDLRPPYAPLTVEFLVQWLAGVCGLPYFEIDPLKIDMKTVTQVLPAAYVRRLQVVPVKVEEGRVWVATAEPYDLHWVTEVQTTTDKKISVVLANPIAIRRLVDEVYTLRSATLQFQREHPHAADFGRVAELDQMLGKARSNSLGMDAPAVTRIVDWLFRFASDERATDIHMEPRMGRGVVRFRIDGRMRVVYGFDPEIMLPLLGRIKVLADMQLDEHRKPQDGRIRYKLDDGREMEMRLSTIPVTHGEKLVIRIFDPKMAAMSFSDLGFSAKDIVAWESLINLPHGLVLVTGPTGSGKSTTLHTSLRRIAGEDVNICTVEDPVEIINDELNQMQVNSKIDVNFANAIRAFLRQDPDIIMVGEIRDADAGKMAIQAALTGHLVLSTLHTNDAISSITRLIDLGIPPHLITASLRGMLAQRLVRRLCDFCKLKVAVPKEAFLEMCGSTVTDVPDYVYEPVGCLACKHSGYQGRLCVYEMVLMDRRLRDAVRRNVTLEELLETAKGAYTPLRASGARRVVEGLTSIDEVMRVVS